MGSYYSQKLSGERLPTQNDFGRIVLIGFGFNPKKSLSERLMMKRPEMVLLSVRMDSKPVQLALMILSC